MFLFCSETLQNLCTMLQYATKVNSVTLRHFGRHEPLLWLALKCFPKRQNARGIDTRPTRVDDSMSRVPNCDAPAESDSTERLTDCHIVPVFDANFTDPLVQRFNLTELIQSRMCTCSLKQCLCTLTPKALQWRPWA